jgi:hypothetical protein
MDGQHSKEQQVPKPESFSVERFLESTFDKLPPDSKVLLSLFGALNSASGLAKGLDLSDKVWKIVRFDGSGPLVGQSEEVNWLKGVCDGILLIADYS